MTPEYLKALFDGNSMIVMLAVGALYTRLPQLKAWTNKAVPWVNAAWYIIATYLLPQDAHAAGFGASLGHSLGIIATASLAAAKSALVSLLYDKFLKGPLDQILPKP